MKGLIVTALVYTPLYIWLNVVCELSGIEWFATAFIIGLTNGIYNAVSEETK